MVRTPMKRHASRSPECSRPPKRAVTSSPEEGELDDGTPPPVPQGHSLSHPTRRPSPVPLSAKAKVPFPFKKKVEPSKSGIIDSRTDSREKVIPVVYERSEEDERKFREADMRWKTSRPPQEDTRRRVQPAATSDHWEPTMNYGRDRDRTVARGAVWDGIHHTANRHHFPSRDLERTSRERRSERDYAALPGPSRSGRDHRDHRDRDRARSSPSPLSPNRSRSPSSQTSTHREKHRLPAPRSPEPSFSPPTRDYGVDRIRDRERQRDDVWDRDRDRRYYEDDDKRSYPRSDGRHRSREWAQESHGQYPRDIHDTQGRYWRPERDSRSTSSRQDYARDDREWTRGDSYEPDRKSKPDDDRDRDSRRGTDSYRPSSPGQSITSHRSTFSLRMQSPSPPFIPQEPQTPPQPSASPPPPPQEIPKDQTLPVEHASVFIPIPLKRPGAPKDVRSPSPLPLPPAVEVNGRGQRGGEKDLEKTRFAVNGREKEAEQEKVVTQARKREPVQRSRKEEEMAYGRVFKGCGRQRDYEVTTKLGEGTFGYV